jgi:S1-C subfamily serine protease
VRVPEAGNLRRAIEALLVLSCALALVIPRSAPAQASGSSSSPGVAPEAPDAALCLVVYPDDQTPAARGYQYTFLGNAFFINDQGYLLTVAHVLETFRSGGEPYILVNRQNAPPQLVRVTVVAKDATHDVAILRATSNPFAGKSNVSFVPLAAEPATRGQAVLALSLHPRRLQDAHSFESQREDSSPGTVLSFESTQLEKSGPTSDVFLLSHAVVKGQSGSPVIAVDSHAAVGLVEGLWLRGVSLSRSKSAALPTDTPGAAIPIRYATALLDQNHISWKSIAAKPAASRSSISASSQQR